MRISSRRENLCSLRHRLDRAVWRQGLDSPCFFFLFSLLVFPLVLVFLLQRYRITLIKQEGVVLLRSSLFGQIPLQQPNSGSKNKWIAHNPYGEIDAA